MSRVEKSIKNSAASIAIQMGTTILNFVSRTIFIRILGEEYLGINGLFGNILNMLSLAELGVGTTITYWLYEPMAKNDETKLSILMAVYKKIYNVIGIAVLILGLSLSPFLSFFMKETPDIPHITFIYVLYVVKMSVSYFFVYKSSLINVAQKNYIVNTLSFVLNVIGTIAQLVVLMLTRNYILYFSVSIAFSLLGNLVLSAKAEKMFPFLKNPIKGKLEKEEKQEIKKDVSAIFSHNIGSFVLTSTDNMIISKFIGVAEVGLYSNYTMILHAVQKMLNLVFSSLVSSIGNLMYSVSKEKSYEVFKNILFAASWIVGFCTISLFFLSNPFITLWLGEQFVFDNYVVFFIVLNFYLTFMRQPVNSFKHCVGLFRKDKYKPFIESIVNLVTSIWLVNKFGIAGVFMGTAISTIAVCMYIEPYILYKYFYEKSVIEYFKIFFKYVLVTIFASVVIYLLSLPINEVTILNFVYKMILCVIVPNGLYWMIFRKTSEMEYFKNLVFTILKKVSKRKG